MKNNGLKNAKAITLIAMVVTIIVLLILAGVSIAVLTGENGIINRTTEAKKTTEEAEVMEKIRLAFLNAQIGKYSVEHSPTDYATFASTMQAELVKTLGAGATVEVNGDDFKVTYNGMIFDVSKTGVVEKVEDISIAKTLTLKIIDGTKTPQNLSATLNGISGTVNWEITSGADKISLTSTTGNTISVTPESEGTATIKASCSGKEATCTVTVESVTSVEVTFNLNGGSVDNSTNSITNRYLPGEPITLPVPTAPSDTPNYKLKGWYDNQAGTGNPVIAKSETSISAPNSNTTYYAQWDESLKYGATADLGTVKVNSTALTRGWQYFYDDGTNIYLIYANYLENSQLPNGTNISKDGYNVYASGNRNNLLNYLNDESTSASGTWSGFAKGVQDALAAKEITVEVKAKGAPTLEQFAGSYQANYPGDKFDVAYRQAGGYINGTSGTTVDVEGYVYKKDSSWACYQSLGNSNKLLYFPETTYSGIRDANASPAQSTDTYGYWLAGLSANGSLYVCFARYDGYAGNYNFYNDGYGVRPVVSIPKTDTLMSKLGLN